MKAKDAIAQLEKLPPDEEVVAVIITQAKIREVAQMLLSGKWIEDELSAGTMEIVMSRLQFKLERFSHDTDIEGAILLSVPIIKEAR